MDTEYDGINRFRNRIGRVMEVINSENPDVIGFQEVTDYMRGVMREHGHALFAAFAHGAVMRRIADLFAAGRGGIDDEQVIDMAALH